MFYKISENVTSGSLWIVLATTAFAWNFQPDPTLSQEWRLVNPAIPQSVPQYRARSTDSRSPPGGYPLGPSQPVNRPGLKSYAPAQENRDTTIPAVDRPFARQDQAGNQERETVERLPMPTGSLPNSPTPFGVLPTPADSNAPPIAPPIAPPLTNPAAPLPTGGGYPLNPPAAAAAPTTAATPANKLPQYGLDYSIYRDRNALPVDPRKPCNPCTHPADASRGSCVNCQWPGKNGLPYQEREPGGCECSSASKKDKGNFSINWPAPFSGIRESIGGDRYAEKQLGDRGINNRFDSLIDFKLIDLKRTDNGYCGLGADPYGCLGESRARGSSVAGIGFRQPGEPAVAPAPFNQAPFNQAPLR